MLKVGDKLKANFSDELQDKVTKGKVYEVIKVTDSKRLGQQMFRILNDEGKETFPIWVSFKKVDDE